MTEQQLVQRAMQARQNAHAPYSHFQVGAALLTSTGHVYVGCNVENSSYGATICAERVAVCSAVAAGEKDFVMLAIAGSGEGFCYPCGICRQVLCDFAPHMRVLCADEQGNWEEYTAAQLLPHAFQLREEENHGSI